MPGRQVYHAASPYVPEPDFSQAAFWQLAAFLGHDVAVAHLPARTSQGDSAFAAMLAALAAPPGDSPRTFDVAQTPDLVPALAQGVNGTRRHKITAHQERRRHRAPL